MNEVTVIGAGLAGCEAAWQLAQRDISVKIWENKGKESHEIYRSELFAELVCSNSLRSDSLSNAVGLLKEEMRRLGSLVMEVADAVRVPAGGALAVDREGFSRTITERICNHPFIQILREEATSIPAGPCIIASGPMTEGAMAEVIAGLFPGDQLHFYDAVAPIVTKESVNMDKAFYMSRYDKGQGDYINCPMEEEEYNAFYDELISARLAPMHGGEGELNIFEGCMPVEVMAARGRQTLAFGPMKPIGVLDPHTGKRPYAVVQLRQDNAADTQYNMVGFQTRLAWPEQKRVFSMIPGLENAEFTRYGVMHRNTYINAPGFLTPHYEVVSKPDVYIAGQLSGVEGYVESAASGMIAGISLARKLAGQEIIDFPSATAIGSLGYYVNKGALGDFVPSNANFGIMDAPEGRKAGRKSRREACSERALTIIDRIAEQLKGG